MPGHESVATVLQNAAKLVSQLVYRFCNLFLNQVNDQISNAHE